MAKDKAAASATATLFIQQTTLTEQAQEIVTAVASELQADSWEFKEGKADITAPLSAAWTKQMAAIGVTDEQSANVVIAASVTLPYATMNATAEAAMKKYLAEGEQQNLRVTGKAAGNTLTFTGDASVSATYASASGSGSVSHAVQNPLVRNTQSALQAHLDTVRAADAAKAPKQ